MPEKVEPRTWKVGTLTVIGPLRMPPRSGLGGTGAPQWQVMAHDTAIEETAEKVFSSATKAQRFIDSLVDGHPPEDPLANEPTRHGLSMVLTTTPTPPRFDGRHTRIDRKAGETVAEHGAHAPFNLKAVAEALTGEGCDPFVEVARAVQERRPVMKGDGTPLIDPKTGEPVMVYVIGPTDRAKILIELGQYVSPKLKAVEVKVEDKRELTAEQLNDRIAAILGRKAEQDSKTIEPEKDAGQ